MNQWTWLLDLILCLHPVLYPVFASVSFKPIALTSPSRGFTVTTRTPPDDFIDTANSNYAQQPSLEAWYFLMLLDASWYFIDISAMRQAGTDLWLEEVVEEVPSPRSLPNPPESAGLGWTSGLSDSHASIQLHCALSFGSSWRVNWDLTRIMWSCQSLHETSECIWSLMFVPVWNQNRPESIFKFSCFPCFASYGFWKPSSSCRRRSCPVNLHFGRVWAFSILERHETNETSWHWGVKKPEIQLQIASMISMCIPCSLNHHDQLANHPITAPDCFISDQMIYVGLFRLFKSLLRYVIRRARQRCHKDRKARRFAKKFDSTPKWPVLVKTYRTTSLVCLERI